MDELKKKNRPYFMIIKRWADLFVLSVISAIIFVIIHPVITKLSSKLDKYFLQSNIYFNLSIPHIIVLFLITTFLWFVLIRLGGFRYHNVVPRNVLHLIRTSYLYPPTWPFAFFGVLLYYWIISLIYNTIFFDWSVIGLSIVSFMPGIIFASILDILFSSGKPSLIKPIHTLTTEKPIKNIRALLQNPSAFINWLNKETPILSSDDDLFDLAIFAKRIARMLQATPLKTIAIVGSYGCGKSSIINMIEEYLKTNERLNGNPTSTKDENHIDADNIIHCKIQGWGFQKNAVVEHILQSVLLELSQSVDCLGLTSIPADYSIALSNSDSSWLKPLAVLSKTTREPLEILRKLDTVLTCTGKRMIIFLEDIDRNTTRVTTWKELTSLLDRLKDLDNISFVLAINQPSMTYDILFRVCEHIEFIPKLPPTEILECIKFFRNFCLDKFSDIDIDCRTRKERDEHIGLKNNSQEYEAAKLMGLEVNNPITVITKILNNPRVLKSALRHSLHSWNSLHGEIDFDDLLAARVIYTVAPEAFAFINENRSKLVDFNAESTSEFIRKKQEENRKQLETAWESINGMWDRGLVKTLIDFLFPGWIKDNFYKGNVPQGVLHSSPTDYWSRLNKEVLTKDEIPDQVMLHAIDNWKKDRNKSVHQGRTLSEAILQIDGFAGKLEHFGHLLDAHEIRSLASELFELIRKDGGKFPKDAHYRGFIELWRLSLDNPVDKHEEWILDEIKKAIPVSLHFANELYYYWRNQDHPSISTRIQTPMLRNGFIEAARLVYANNKSALITAIDPTYMYSIYHFMILYSTKDQGGSGFDPTEWKWLIDVLLDAGATSPQVVIPQLVPLISNETSKGLKGFLYTIDENRLDSLFVTEKARLLKLLAMQIDISMFDEREKNHIEYVRNEAAKRIMQEDDM